MAHAAGGERRHYLRPALRHGIVERVSAADVGRERMLHADAVAELHQMVVAGTAAVGLVGAGRKHRAKHAVLHVKHRHVLMDHHLEPLRRRGRDEGEQLLAVHVVRRGDPLDARTLKKLGRELVGDVERKIGDDRQALRPEKLQAAEVADEHAVGLLLGQ